MTVLIALGMAVTRADVPALCAGLADQLRGRPGDVVVCDVSEVTRPDVVTVEALARLRLTAERHGRRFTVRGAGPELLTLFRLTGLGAFLAARPASTGRGQAEQREQPGGVEEVVDAGDAPV